MFIEILAKSFIWIIYCMLFTLLLRLIGLTPNLENLVFKYPEIFFIIVAILLMAFNYFTTNKIHI